MELAKKVDIVNIGLIILAFAMAILLPFKLFIYSYAILGPLHYLTEISWLDGKQYFTKSRNPIWVGTLLALLVALPYLGSLEAVQNAMGAGFHDFLVEYSGWTNGFILLAFAAAVAFLFFVSRKQQWLVVGIGAVLAILFKNVEGYKILIGTFLPTLIHVYLFTILFMLYGALRSKSKPGLLAVTLTLLAPILLIFIEIDPGAYDISNSTKEIYAENQFHNLVARLSQLLGLSDGSTFSFDKVIDLKLQVFIAFAYAYHYLNWFSKTTTIGWHKNLSSTRTMLIGVLWIISVGLYWYDYRTGFVVLLFLSVLHVFVEFPLNIVSIKGIWQTLKERKKES